jgi:uncharacterized membrane protein HdeD (DUF308 family)
VGIVALAWPGITVLGLVVLFAVYAFIAAGMEAVRAFSSERAGHVLGHLLLGLVDVGAGVVALAWPGPTALVLVLLVGAWATIGGLVEIYAGFEAGESAGTRALLFVSGLVSIAFGIVLFAHPVHRRRVPCLAVRLVQPGLWDMGTRAGRRPAPGPPHSGLAARRGSPKTEPTCISRVVVPQY